MTPRMPITRPNDFVVGSFKINYSGDKIYL